MASIGACKDCNVDGFWFDPQRKYIFVELESEQLIRTHQLRELNTRAEGMTTEFLQIKFAILRRFRQGPKENTTLIKGLGHSAMN